MPITKKSSAADTMRVQEALAAVYYDLSIDGDSGPETQRQASNFAFEHGLRVDASSELVIGDDVIAALAKAPKWARLIDVSKWNGDGGKYGALPDFAKVKAGGICGAYIKAGGADGGLYTDVAFNANWRNARNAGLLRGAYFFHTFSDANTAEEQAEKFYKIVGGHTPGDLPPCLDVEDRASPSMAPDKAAAHVRRTLERMRELSGVTPLLYTSASALGYRKIDTKTNGLEAYPLWVPRYPKPPYKIVDLAKSIPQCYPNKKAWSIWQLGNSANMRGVINNVDRNFFQGTEEELRAFFKV